MPVGDYIVVISKSEVKRNKKDNGDVLRLEYDVVSGEFKGRKLWAYLNISHANKQAEQIGKGELSAICRACAVLTPRDSSDLHDIPHVVRVGVEEDESGEKRNVVKRTLWKVSAAEMMAEPVGVAAIAGDDIPF